MLRNRTLFVLGAGASAEIGMPLGSQLAETINRSAGIVMNEWRGASGTGDGKLFEAVRQHYTRNLSHAEISEQVQRIAEAASLIRAGSSLAASIDDFLNTHRDNEYVQTFGKTAIVKCILEAERKSKLFFDEANGAADWHAIKDTWFARLFSMLSRGVTRHILQNLLEKAAFITFNYDRSLEHFLTHAIKDFFGVSAAEAANFVDGGNIVHPYGTVGILDPGRSPHARTRFGNIDDPTMVQRAHELRTYTEELNHEENRNRIYKFLDEAQVIVFLGFAFHEQNVSLLASPNEAKGPRDIFSTAYGISKPDCAVIASSLGRFFPEGTRNIFVPVIESRMHADLKCVQLLDYYSKTLST